MKTRVLVIVLVLLTVVNLTGFGVMLVHRARAPQPLLDRHPLREHVMRSLGLTREQRQALRSFRRQFVDRTRSLRESLHGTHCSLVDEMREAEPDLDRVDSLVMRISQLQGEIQRIAVRSMLEEKEKLAPEQQERLFGLYRDFVERHRPMREALPRHGGGAMHGRRHRAWKDAPVD